MDARRLGDVARVEWVARTANSFFATPYTEHWATSRTRSGHVDERSDDGHVYLRQHTPPSPIDVPGACV